jgi:hypothetical protein
MPPIPHSNPIFLPIAALELLSLPGAALKLLSLWERWRGRR